jgi:hypothetical protein
MLKERPNRGQGASGEWPGLKGSGPAIISMKIWLRVMVAFCT